MSVDVMPIYRIERFLIQTESTGSGYIVVQSKYPHTWNKTALQYERLFTASARMYNALKFIVEQTSNPANADDTLGAWINGAGFNTAKELVEEVEGICTKPLT